MTDPFDNKKINVAVLGASGRTGSEVVKILEQESGFEIQKCWVSGNSTTSVNLESVHNRLVYKSFEQSDLEDLELIIDFSSPKASLELLQACLRVDVSQKLPVILLATTGFSDEELGIIEQVSKRTYVLCTGNTSLGIFALKKAATLVQTILGKSFDVEILELHHRRKKDAPSGTAKLLALALLKDGSGLETVFPRQSTLRGEQEIGMASLRGGDIVGEHTIYFIGEDERIELTHRASSRVLFARGAIELGRLLCGYNAEQKNEGMRAGLIQIDDLYR